MIGNKLAFSAPRSVKALTRREILKPPRCGVQIHDRFFARLCKASWGKQPVPPHNHAIHFQALVQRFGRCETTKQSVTELPEPEPRQRSPAALAAAILAIMFVEIPVSIPKLFDLETDGKPARHLPPKMSDACLCREPDRKT